TNDVFRMGGLFRAMPHTGIVFIVGTLALAGVPPLAGFFSKEAVLGGVWEAHLTGPFLMLALTALLTAFYMFRVVFIAFFGRAHAAGHPHEAPWLMRGPLWILALLTILVGLRLAAVGAQGHEEARRWLARLSVGLALAGFLLAWAMYQRGAIAPARVAAALGPLDFMARRRYGLDALYAGLYRGIMLGFSRLIGWIDRYLVDGLLNVLSALTLRGGGRLRGIQSGRAQDYVYGVAFGLLFLIVWAQLWRERRDAPADPGAVDHHVVAVRRRAAHHVHRAPPAAGGPVDRRGDHQPLGRAVDPHLRGVRLRDGRVPVLREASAGAAARHLVRARRRRDQPADAPADVDHHRGWSVRVLDRPGAEPGVLRAAAGVGHRRVRRVRVARPLRAVPVLRAGRAADVPADRHLGIDGRGASPRRVRLGVPGDRRRDERVRGDEADALPPVRVGVHPGRDSRPLRQRRRHLVLVPRFRGLGVSPRSPALGLSGLLRRLRHPRRNLAAAYVVARRPRLGADGGLEAPRRRADEARGLRRRPGGHGAPARGRGRSRVAGRDD